MFIFKFFSAALALLIPYFLVFFRPLSFEALLQHR
jgi:hypothetical protein